MYSVRMQLTTPRLLLRAHQPDDLPFMLELNSDPEVIRYTGDPPFESEAEALAILARLERQQERDRMSRLVVIDRATGEKLGWCGLKWMEEEQEVDLGYRFHRRYWSKGYATESSIACLEYGFGELKLDRIVARAMAENVASVRVLEKLGFRRIGSTTIGDASALSFEFLREEWRRPSILPHGP